MTSLPAFQGSTSCSRDHKELVWIWWGQGAPPPLQIPGQLVWSWDVALPAWGEVEGGRRVQAKAEDQDQRQLDSLPHTEHGFWVLGSGTKLLERGWTLLVSGLCWCGGPVAPPHLRYQ